MQGKKLGLRAGARRARAARDRRRRRRLLCRAGPRARALAAAGRRVRRLHRAPQAQRLPVAAHRRAGRRRPADRNADPHPRDARARRASAWRRTGPTRRPAPRGYAGVSASGEFEDASPRRARPCCASCWPGSATSRPGRGRAAWPGGGFDDRIYVFTPQAAIIELPAGATPVDFAYSAAHRPRPPLPRRARRRRDGAAEHAAANGQTVEIIVAKEGGPSLDWLNPELRLPGAARARGPRCVPGSTRRQQAQTIARGREAVEKLLQREGKHGDQARRPGRAARLQATPRRCSRWSARTSSRCATSRPCCARPSRRRRRRAHRPAPPRARAGARPRRRAGGRRRVAADHAGALLPAGAARRDRRLRHARQGRGRAPRATAATSATWPRAAPERVIAVAWGAPRGRPARRVYPVDVIVEAGDRPGPAARHLGGLRQGADERHRRQHPVASKDAQRRHRVDDLHRRGRRRRAPGPGAGAESAAGGAACATCAAGSRRATATALLYSAADPGA